MDYDKLALDLHRKYHGKITTSLRDTSDLNEEKLSSYYSPGVGAVAIDIYKNPQNIREYTWVNNLVAIISDGSAVLGLGNLGAKAAMPVMEGKALLFKHFANIDSVPIVLDTQDTSEIIKTIKNIAPSFGAINLEDISAPRCFEIEDALKKELDIPVFHDDQHGTAIVVLAGLFNALKVTNRNLEDSKIVVVGVGAAGSAIIKLLHLAGAKHIVAVDRDGIVTEKTAKNSQQKNLLNILDTSAQGSLADAVNRADVFIGVSRGGLLLSDMVKTMNPDPIIFALANPTPEIMPDEALQAGAKIVATGRSDFPNQVNNALVFPGIFRGALDNNVKQITDEHKLAAAQAIAALVKNPTADEIVPSPFNQGLVPAIADAIY